MIDQVTFNQWMNDFFQTKFNQLSYSNTRYPKRVEKVTLNLATAPTQPIKISVPFKSVLVSRIYSTSTPTTDKAGSIKILFDYDNLMNIQNAVSLFPNDSFDMDTETAQAFLTWDAQSDTSIDLFFFVDIAFRAGTTKTQIVGTVTTTPANISSTNVKPGVMTSFQKLYANNGTDTYTIPAGSIGILSFALNIQGAGVGCHIKLDGTYAGIIFNNVGRIANSNIILPAGTVVLLTSLDVNCDAMAQIAVYPTT